MVHYVKFAAVGLALGLVAAGPGLAGPPDNPGTGGTWFVQSHRDYQQESAGNPNGWGQATRRANQYDHPPLGQRIQEARPTMGATPNPASDNGKGND